MINETQGNEAVLEQNIEGTEVERGDALAMKGAMEEAGVSKGGGKFTEEQTQQLAELFQTSYDIMYKDNNFDTVIDSVEDGSLEVSTAVAQLTSTLITAVVRDQGVTDINMLYSLGLLLITDMFDSLTQIGVEVPPDAMASAVAEGVSSVIADSPEIIETMKANPELQELVKGIQNNEAPPQAGPEGVMGRPTEGVV